MRMTEIITSKRAGQTLTREEIEFFVRGYTDGSIPDYQASALLMAICFSSMDSRETSDLAMAMVRSGDTVDLSGILGIKVDKHSTGGVGDKTTLIAAPIAAACGVSVPKLSGRGLAHTGGTIDKLESIPGMRTDIGIDEFIEIVNRTGLCVASATADLAPADKKLYALRDATSTVDSIPLIAASVMSKKLAAGADAILLDVKVGSGAFMKSLPQAKALAKQMKEIGESAGRSTAALITDMDSPLGCAVGNSLEVIEAVNTLRGIGPQDLTELCIAIASSMLALADKGTKAECISMARNALYGGKAFEKLCQMVDAQGGDCAVLLDTNKFRKAQYFRSLRASQSGYIFKINAEAVGRSAMLLGAGRMKKDDVIDPAAGIIFNSRVGDSVGEGEIIATLFSENESSFDAAAALLGAAVAVSDEPPAPHGLLLGKA